MFQPKGIVPAMVTPLDSQGRVNQAVLRQLTNHLIDGGVHGLFVVGSQGEFYALSPEQKRTAIATVVSEARGRVPVYAGTGAVTTAEACLLAKVAEDEGADAVSVITPYYIEPSQDELYEHYAAIAKSTRLPVLLYTNPARTGVKLSVDLVARLAKVDGVVGMKDSSGDMTLLGEYIRRTPPTFSVLVGRDTLIYAALCYGAKGAIAATANVAPRLVVEIYEAFIAGDHDRARLAQQRLAPLRIAFELGTFPVVIKEALNMMGFEVGDTVLPVGKLADAKRQQLGAVLRDMGLLARV